MEKDTKGCGMNISYANHPFNNTKGKLKTNLLLLISSTSSQTW